MGPEELGHYVALRRQYDYFGIGDLCKIPGFSGALRRARLRFPRGLAERRVVGSDTCKGTRNADWTCTVCGKVTFGSKKTDQCFHCKTVRTALTDAGPETACYDVEKEWALRDKEKKRMDKEKEELFQKMADIIDCMKEK